MTIDAESLLCEWSNGESQHKIKNKLKVYAANVPGTQQYWKSTFWDFKAISMHLDYMYNRIPSIFHTMTISEFHDPFLCLLMAKYMKAIKNESEEMFERIMSDDAFFHDAVYKYKNIVTNYYAAKEEIWLGTFLHPVYGVVDVILTHEFGKSRGAIHGHSVEYCKKELDGLAEIVSEILADLADDTVKAVELLDSFIASVYDPTIHGMKYPENPKDVISSQSLKVRERFCNEVDNGKKHFLQFKKALKKSDDIASKKIAKELESKWGMSALHPGNAPHDWVKPGGLAEMGYRSCSNGMQSSKDILKEKEFKN